MNYSNVNKKKSIILIIIIAIFYFFTVFIATNVLNTNTLTHKLIHINSKVVGSRWVYQSHK